MTDVQHSDPYQGLVFIFQSVSLQAALPVAVDILWHPADLRGPPTMAEVFSGQEKGGSQDWPGQAWQRLQGELLALASFQMPCPAFVPCSRVE